MTIAGVGLDLIDLKAFEVHYGNFDQELLERCFTRGEIAMIGDGVDRLERFAGRFAVKEATLKALGGGLGLGLLDVETFSTDAGAPGVRLNGPTLARATELCVTYFFVTISHSAASAGAVVIACTGPT